MISRRDLLRGCLFGAAVPTAVAAVGATTTRWYAIALVGDGRPIKWPVVNGPFLYPYEEWRPKGAGVDLHIASTLPDDMTIEIDGRLATLGDIRRRLA